jgi:hypothetical protein
VIAVTPGVAEHEQEAPTRRHGDGSGMVRRSEERAE